MANIQLWNLHSIVKKIEFSVNHFGTALRREDNCQVRMSEILSQITWLATKLEVEGISRISFCSLIFNSNLFVSNQMSVVECWPFMVMLLIYNK